MQCNANDARRLFCIILYYIIFNKEQRYEMIQIDDVL
jgi:hypothetical protein